MVLYNLGALQGIARTVEQQQQLMKRMEPLTKENEKLKEGSIWIAEFLLVFLTPVYFFMARETAFFDMTSCILEIVDACSDVLVDFLVMLARVVDVVPPSSPLEGLSIIVMLIDKMASTGAAIGSWHGGSVI